MRPLHLWPLNNIMSYKQHPQGTLEGGQEVLVPRAHPLTWRCALYSQGLDHTRCLCRDVGANKRPNGKPV